MQKIIYNKTNIFPNKIICIGRNFVSHAEELGNEVPKGMIIFFKPNSCIASEIILHDKDEVHFESELSFLINANKLVAVSFGLDLTKRAVQARLKAEGLPWERAKAFHGSAVFSEFVSFSKLKNLRLELTKNGELVQSGGVNLMINKPEEILTEVLTFSDIDDGDIIMSGTPKGVGELQIGDILIGKVFEKDKLLIEKKWLVR